MSDKHSPCIHIVISKHIVIFIADATPLNKPIVCCHENTSLNLLFFLS